MVHFFGYNMSISLPLMYSFEYPIGRSAFLFICILFIYNQSHYVLLLFLCQVYFVSYECCQMVQCWLTLAGLSIMCRMVCFVDPKIHSNFISHFLFSLYPIPIPFNVHIITSYKLL